MPFGLTGTPSTFAEVTAHALGDLIGTLIQHSWVEEWERTRLGEANGNCGLESESLGPFPGLTDDFDLS